jgi:hypothetical protein
LEKLLQSDPPPQGVDLGKLAGNETGNALMAQVGIVQLKEALEESLGMLKIVLLGISDPAQTLQELSTKWAPSKPGGGGSPAAGSPSVSEPTTTRMLVLEEDAGDMSRAILLWTVDDPKARPGLTTALHVLANRFRAQQTNASRLSVVPSGGLFAHPAIFIDGPHDQVLRALELLQKNAEDFSAELGGPSSDEWELAVRLARPVFEQTVPCQPGFEPDEAEDAEVARRSLRLVPRVAVLWGTEVATSTDESND